MSRTFACWSALAALSFAPLASADSIELRAIAELREKLEEQSKQIEALTLQVSNLAQSLETSKAPAPAPLSAAPSPPPAASEAPGETSLAEVRRAEAVPQPAKHVVAKGETLTSIAKQHNITITDLQKVNKIENDRKLQIGQSLIIPTPKIPESPTEKKETP